MEAIFNRKFLIFSCLCLFLILCGCIIKYNAKGIDEASGILVVDGVITDGESDITLNWSINLTAGDESLLSYVDSANVYVECDDGSRVIGYPDYSGKYFLGLYKINTGTLNPDRQYRLKIKIGALEYCSDYSHPLQTSEIDSVFWVKTGSGQPVQIFVTTHDSENRILYYRWSYEEVWEYHADVNCDIDHYFCWDKSKNNDFLLGSTERIASWKLNCKLVESSPYDKRWTMLYRIDVTQNEISKGAYDFFTNIKKNAQQSGTIFAPIPSELGGNITCTTNPGKSAIGYVDVSKSMKKRLYIPYSDEIYENNGVWCDTCCDCRSMGSVRATSIEPDDWPDQ